MHQEKKLFNYAVWLLARRSYHSCELRNKIMQKKHAPREEAEKIISKLQKNNALNDQQYLAFFIRDQLHRKPQSIRLIKQKLIKKGIPQEHITLALGQEPTSQNDYVQARKALQLKLPTMKALAPLQKKQKLYRFLVSRGFSSNTILKILNEIIGEQLD